MRLEASSNNPRQCSSGILNIRENYVPIDVPRCSLVARLSLLFTTGCYCRVSLHVVEALVCVSFQPRQQFNILPNMETTAHVQLNQIVQRRRMTGREICKKKKYKCLTNNLGNAVIVILSSCYVPSGSYGRKVVVFRHSTVSLYATLVQKRHKNAREH